MTHTIKLQITALEDNHRKFAVVCLGVKVAVAFDRDSGGRVARGARLVSGSIDSGGSRANWYCIVTQGSVFEIEVDETAYIQNKNRLKKWSVVVIDEFSTSAATSEALESAQSMLE